MIDPVHGCLASGTHVDFLFINNIMITATFFGVKLRILRNYLLMYNNIYAIFPVSEDAL